MAATAGCEGWCAMATDIGSTTLEVALRLVGRRNLTIQAPPADIVQKLQEARVQLPVADAEDSEIDDFGA